jgi:hypothetical protein
MKDAGKGVQLQRRKACILWEKLVREEREIKTDQINRKYFGSGRTS